MDAKKMPGALLRGKWKLSLFLFTVKEVSDTDLYNFYLHTCPDLMIQKLP